MKVWGWLLTLLLDGHWQQLRKQATRTRRYRWPNLLFPIIFVAFASLMVLHLHCPTIIPLTPGLLLDLMWKLYNEKAFQLFLLFLLL